MIIVFGSINIDQVYQVGKLPAPGETVLGSGYTQVPGGKGANQALAARRSGAEVAMVGCVGGDANGDLALALMKNDGVSLDHISKCSLPTGCASIWVDGQGENSIVVYSGANEQARAEQVSLDQLASCGLLLLQMEVNAAENWKLLEIAKRQNVPTLLNVAPVGSVPTSALHNLDYLVVNEIEAAELARQHHLDPKDEEALALMFAEKFDLCCLLTLGARGVLAANGGQITRVAAMDITPVDTTAAGDSFIGGFAAAISKGNSLENALEYATKVAALTCTRLGAQSSIPFISEVT
ncbi:MAG: ribokinase [Sneathiella sp.]